MGAATMIVNAKVFDGTKSQGWSSVRFADGLITQCSVAPAAQEGDEVIDAGGGTGDDALTLAKLTFLIWSSGGRRPTTADGDVLDLAHGMRCIGRTGQG